MAGAACATATSARFHEDMTVPDWFDPGHADNVVWRVPPRGYPPNVDLSSTLGALLRVALRHSDVLTMTRLGWGPRGPGRWIAFPGNDFRLRT